MPQVENMGAIFTANHAAQISPLGDIFAMNGRFITAGHGSGDEEVVCRRGLPSMALDSHLALE